LNLLAIDAARAMSRLERLASRRPEPRDEALDGKLARQREPLTGKRAFGCASDGIAALINNREGSCR
jgi:hypothetical protein